MLALEDDVKMHINRFPSERLTGDRQSRQSKVSLANNLKAMANSTGLEGYRNLLSRSVPSMSDDEMKEAAIQQAQKDAASGVFQGADMERLRRDFMSTVSPDRKGIISKQFSTLSAKSNGGTSNISVSHSGREIAHFKPGRGWANALTKQESARSQEILQVYNEAWRNARFGVGGNGSDDNRPVNARNMFDSQA